MKSAFRDLVFEKILPEPMSGCWIWMGALNKGGYGQFTCQAHRMVYLIERGPVMNGLHLDHLCHNTCCVNPDHLQPVTPKINVHRALAWRAKFGSSKKRKKKFFCVNGHPRKESGLSDSGHCLLCRREQHTKRNKKVKTLLKRLRNSRYPQGGLHARSS